MKNINKYKLIIVLLVFVLSQILLFNTIISFSANDETKTIDNGTYVIKLASNDNYVLDVSGASKANAANVALYQYNGQANQQFKIEYVSNGYYRIIASHSDKLLDVHNSGKANETNVEQYQANNPISSNQKWKIIKNSDNTYSFVSECNGLYLDAYRGEAKNGTNIQVYQGNGGNSQKFKLEPIQIVNNGTYTIKLASNDNYVLDVSGASKANAANVALYQYNGQTNQQFKIEYVNNGYYRIIASHSDKLLDVHNSGKANETNVEQYQANNPISSNQKWKIIKNSDNTYSFVSECNGLYLDAYRGEAKNGTNIQVYQGNGGNSQKFKIEVVGADNNTDNKNDKEDKNEDNDKSEIIQGEQTIADGVYSIATGVSDNYVLDVEGGSRNNTANIQVFKKQSANRQKFKVEYLGDGCYKIMSVYSNKVLDAENNGMQKETNVCQYQQNNPISNNQKWIIKNAGDGYYYIISKLNGLYLDLYKGSATNGSNVQLYTGNGGKNQKFKFVQPLNVVDSINASKYPGYKEKINSLMEQHPGWNFELLYTGLKFDDVVSGEYNIHNANLVPSNYGGEWICSKCGTKQYDTGWYGASEKAIAYYMDPRNFLDEVNVFQFQDVNEYVNKVCTLNGIISKVDGTFLKNYATSIDNACRNQNVNSYYIIARVLQEQGSKGTTIGTGMNGGNGRIYYNPFNIGASGNTTNEVYNNALATAKKNGWDSMQKGLEGGITFCKKNWLENYQNTLYQNKFDIDHRGGSSLYTHQYMQNLIAAYSEARNLRSMYANTNTLESNFTFIIPMYENMNTTLSQMPNNNTETSPINVQITANGGLNIRKSADTNSEVLRTISQYDIILSVQRGINTNWQKVITIDGLIGYMSGTYLKQVNDITNCNYTAKVKTSDGSGCNVRVGPSTELDKITALSDGISVTVINIGTYNNINGINWCRVRLSDGRQGFMPDKFLRR